MSENRKDLPAPSAPNFEQRLRETVMTYLGKQGDPLDRGLTVRDLVANGVLTAAESETWETLTLKVGVGVAGILLSLAWSVAEKKLLKSVTLFDVYEGEKLGEGKKSYALNFIIQDETKTLTDVQIDGIMNNLIAAYEKEVNAKLR